MTGISVRAAATVAIGLAALISASPSTIAQPPFFDPERLFMMSDADLDGRLSLTEYRDQILASPRMRGGAAATIEPMFRRLDSNRDGVLSMSEYARVFARGPGAGPGFGPNAGPGAFPGGGAGNGRAIPAPRGADAGAKGEPKSPMSAEIGPEPLAFFETKIRPVLATQCGKCHSSAAEKLKGGLRVDSRDGLRVGGDMGAAIVPGDLEASLLIRAIRYEDEDLRMPPKGKLPQSVIADFETWVKMGAPDPRGAAAEPQGETARTSPKTPTQASELWSFRPAVKRPAPQVKQADWPRDEIDRFLLAALESRGLTPVGDADRLALLRRVTFDLVGLPPSPDEIEGFLNDSSPHALSKTVDRLLASPRFGEKWGRHWLDVARFAESSGKTNFTYPQAWRYRDWVIAALNDDKPYDQFVREQIAGDLLPADNDRRKADQIIATGFLAVGGKAQDAENRGQFLLDVIDEQIEATSRAFLGLTIACARCHDHKMDPISQRDYYAMSGIFRSTLTCSGTLAGVFPNFNASPLIELAANAEMPMATPPVGPEQRKGMEAGLAGLLRERDSIPPGEANRDRMRRNNSMLSMLKYRLAVEPADAPRRAFAMGVRERDQAIDSPLFIRGELDKPGEPIPRGLPQALRHETSHAIKSGSGRRELADWLASPQNPLTPRVIVNRVWLRLYGRGLAATPDNFGSAGAAPSHPELLDALAVDFVADGWSIKKLIRRIVLTRSYGLASTYDPRDHDADPDNVLVWRMSKRRMEAEAIRDALLSVSGRLNLQPPIGSAAARAGEGLAFFIRPDGPNSSDVHRSIYLTVVRDQTPEALALFDFADPSLVTGERAVTTGPAQALYFMNSPFVLRQADAFADRLRTAETDDARRIDLAYRLALGRLPAPSEREQALTFLRRFAEPMKNDPWPAFCQALVGSAEFRYLD